MRQWPVGSVALAVVLVAGGCTGGDVEPTPSTTSQQPSPTVRDGEYTPDPSAELCRAVSTRSLRKLGMSAPRISSYGECRWSQDDSGDRYTVRRELTVAESTYSPPLTRRSYTATKEARARFRRLEGWTRVPTVPMRRFGDEAKVARFLQPAVKRAEVWLAVRDRNTVIVVKSRIESLADSGDGRMPTFDQVEEGTLAAARELLVERTGDEQPLPARRKYADGEFDTVRPVCSAVPTAGRVLPGVRRWDTSRRGGQRTGCAWTDNESEQPSLTVDVEAVSPSRTTGDDATAVARALFYTGDGKRLTSSGLGDEAKLDWHEFDGGKSRTARLLVRQRNLLVSVEHDRWQHPDKQRMRADAIAAAKDVLRGYE